MAKFLFPQKLSVGLIVSRPNRFVMFVKINDEVLRCHCPATGRLAGIDFGEESQISCLLSPGHPGRPTPYTVEAIRFAGETEWNGINQGGVNRYVEYFLGQHLLPRLTSEAVTREHTVGHSRIDFITQSGTLIEVKTPLWFVVPENIKRLKRLSKGTSMERLARHFGVLRENCEQGLKSILLLCYINDAPRFNPGHDHRAPSQIRTTANAAHRAGVDTWQANFRIDAEGVELMRYFHLKLRVD